jgi:hypothetical protein
MSGIIQTLSDNAIDGDDDNHDIDKSLALVALAAVWAVAAVAAAIDNDVDDDGDDKESMSS